MISMEKMNIQQEMLIYLIKFKKIQKDQNNKLHKNQNYECYYINK